MPENKNLITLLVSIAALLGPLSYLFFAAFESGRLDYLGAPTEFLQISSFGIRPVAEAIYPMVLVSMVFASLAIGIKNLPGTHKLAMAGGILTYGLILFCYISLTPKWQWIFGLAAVVAGLGTLAINRTSDEMKADLIKPLPSPITATEKLFFMMTRMLMVCVFAFTVIGIWIAVGEKQAATQKPYWIVGGDVVLGFYGDLALTAELHGTQVGPSFKIVELKSLSGSLSLRNIGPLSAAPVWKSELRE
jgi:hypothetical protein